MSLIAAIDVGTGSARAGVFDATGRLLGRAEAALDLRRDGPRRAEQSSAQIWEAVGAALRAARAEAGVPPEAIAALAFDATCSLVVRDAAGRPVGVTPGAPDAFDTILWLDHRALDEAEAIDAHRGAGPGEAISPEMALPKLLWLAHRHPAAWARAARVLDLADFLGRCATGTDARSLCPAVCKWGWTADQGWPTDLLAALGLTDFARTGAAKPPVPIAADLGPLTPAAAAHLGLTTTARVGAGLVDAHAGALAVLGRFASDPDRMARNVALIAGTSTCLMRLAPGGAPRPGVWGPYPDAVLPGFTMTEGGQSASGALLDHVLRGPGGGPEPDAALHARVAARIDELRRDDPDLAPWIHVLPDFHGNRTPQADARARGMILGLDLDGGFDGLCRLYYRTAVGLALGLRETLDALTADGPAPEALHAAGGHARNPLLMALYADAAGVEVHEPLAPDPVLLGTAMTAAVTAGLHPDLAAAAEAMGQGTTIRRPDPSAAGRMARDTQVLKAMRALQRPVNTG
jgi:FGGY-family pentulose kinase